MAGELACTLNSIRPYVNNISFLRRKVSLRFASEINKNVSLL